MSLSSVEFFNGFFTLLFVVFSFIVGIRISLNYRETKSTTFLLVGLSWMGMASPWYPSTFSFLSVILTGKGLNSLIYMMIGNVIIPITVIIWFIAFTDLFYKEYQKYLVGLISSISILYEIFFLYFLFTDSKIIGEVTGPVDVRYGILVTSFQIFLIIIVLLTGTLFAVKSLKLEDPEVKLRGKLLLIAFYSFIFGAVLDILSPTSIMVLILARIILIVSALIFYLAFVLPDFLKKLLL
ncbi:MAG: hypothetical protein GF383_04305 [Candidatus Lokiarchaeota archaeon]|nr:hypothetical protein [Candidatus Lokiarchaeota archaeon]MBD3338982.1 hypothetical protein [Candidatus Lokiarchaeota archaeon]